MNPQLEKLSETVRFRATPTEVKNFKQASGGNVSDWLRGMANERAGVATTQKLTQKPVRR